MKTNIIVSNTKSRFLEVVKTARDPNINFYFIDLLDIFKAYDVLQPKHILLDKNDLNNSTISLFMKEPQIPEKLFINNDSQTYRIINKNLFTNTRQENIKTKNLAILNISDKEHNLIKMLEDNNINFHLFNSSLRHKYNLGTIEYIQTPSILEKYHGVIGYDNIYSVEALLSGCVYYNIGEDLINNLLNNICTEIQEPEDISSFIENNFYDK